MKNLKLTVEDIKLGEDEGFIGYIRTTPPGVSEPIGLLHKKLKYKNDTIIVPHSNSIIINMVDSILTKWINRELTMYTNSVSIDSILTDLKDLSKVEDGLVSVEIKRILKKLADSLENDYELTLETSNNNYLCYVEPYKIFKTNVKIHLPDEIFTTPMDITRSKLYSEINSIVDELDKNVLNILIDGNGNSFLINVNMNSRVVIKLFTNKDIVTNQVTGL